MAMWRRSRAVRVTAVILGVLLSIGALGAPASSATRAGQVTAARPWLNARHTPEQRARLLLAQMTLAEKVDLMTGNQGEAPYAFYNAPIPRLGIPALKMADAGGGVAPRGWTLPDTGGKATAMPSEMALGATWSPDVVRKFAAVVAAEVRETGQNVLLAPDTDIARLPWFGRISESQGEDPILNGDLNGVYAATVQAHNVIATLKHYTANNQETNRGAGQNAIMDERTLREVYTLAFEAVIARAGLGAVMCSFNKINGEYSCENAMTLRTVLKGQLHFTGFVMSDFGALHDTLKGLTAGDDLETGTTTVYDGALLAAVQSGQASLALVNDACLRILTSMFRIGLFDTDYTPTAIPVAAHHAVARAVQAKAITLLKNSGHALPLRREARKSIAVIGADANILAAESGSAWVDPTVSTPTLQGITARAGADAKVSFTPGNDPVNAASMIETADMTAVPSSVLTPARGTGPGLTAQYWHAPSFAGPPAVTRVERQVNYDVGFASTFPNWAGAGTQVPLPPVNFFLEQQAVAYDGFLTAPATGDYVLSLTGWGDATLSLDGTTIIDMTGQDGRRVVNSPTLHLVAGKQYALHIEYRATRPLTGLQPGTLLLQWRTPPRGAVAGDPPGGSGGSRRQGRHRLRARLRDRGTRPSRPEAAPERRPADQARSAPPTRTPWWCSPPAARSPCRGSARSLPWCRPTSAGKPRAARSPTCSGVTSPHRASSPSPTRPASRQCRRGSPTPGTAPPTRTSPTARASTSATRATTGPVSTRCSRSATACRTPRSSTGSSRSTRPTRTQPGSTRSTSASVSAISAAGQAPRPRRSTSGCRPAPGSHPSVWSATPRSPFGRASRPTSGSRSTRLRRPIR